MEKYFNVNFEESSDNGLRGAASKDYVFKCDIEVKEGDLVVCETSRGYGVGKVVSEEFKDTRIKAANAWIVGMVDLSAHKARLEREKKMAELKAKMNERKKRLEDEAVFKLLAAEDTEMAALLAEFNTLKG